MKINVLNHLENRIRSWKSKGNFVGDLFGIRDGSTLFILACSLHTHQAAHDPQLILPANFQKVGTFLTADHDAPIPDLVEDLTLVYCDAIQIYLKNQESQQPTLLKFKTITEAELWKTFVLAQVCFNKKITCEVDEKCINDFIDELKEEVSSKVCFFKSERTKLLLHIGSEQDEKLMKSTLNSIAKTPNKKCNIPLCSFQLYKNKTCSDSTPHAPLVQIRPSKNRVLQTSMQCEAISYLPKSTLLSKVAEYLILAVHSQIELARYWLHEQANNPILVSPLKTYLINHYLIGHVMALMYPCDSDEAELSNYRLQMQKALALPINKPVMRRANVSYLFSERLSSVLINPHESVPKSGVEEGTLSTVKGFYGYHHYMQDNFDDNKWGCAYRSLQTLISWFQIQAYTDKMVPSHSKIQQILVDMKDKPASFVGSRQWIGSTEVGFVMETYLDVSSRFISVNSGADLGDHGRELCRHFENVGTPIMIGGGVLAHTIIGVDWSEVTGEIKYLILDPHYTGGENLNQIIKQGWCGWKDSSFWKANAYYNLCLPQLPNVV